MQKTTDQVELEHYNTYLRSKITENERVQQQEEVDAGQEYNVIQAYLSRNTLQLNTMEPFEDDPSGYSLPLIKSLHIG
ncbi:hypothetical protein Tco_1188643 [Tanacetum coccineum]